MPDFKYSILVDFSLNLPKNLPLNTTVELFGEVKLKSDEKTVDSGSLIEELGQLQNALEKRLGYPHRKPTGLSDKGLNSTVRMQLQKRADEIKKQYTPIIQAHFLHATGNAKELITMNLCCRKFERRIE